jgi:hypothetical protein
VLGLLVLLLAKIRVEAKSRKLVFDFAQELALFFFILGLIFLLKEEVIMAFYVIFCCKLSSQVNGF